MSFLVLWYTIMVDETTNLADIEQMVFCLHYVDDSLQAHEEVIGLHSMETTSAENIMTIMIFYYAWTSS